MIFYFDAFGNLLGNLVDRIYQGSNQANSIYFIAPITKDADVYVKFHIPNGEVTAKYPLSLYSGDKVNKIDLFSSKNEQCNIWRAKIPFAVTKLSGNVGLQFFAVLAGQTVSTASITFTVEKGVYKENVSDELSYTELIDRVNTLINKHNQYEAIAISSLEEKNGAFSKEGTFVNVKNLKENLKINGIFTKFGVKNLVYFNKRYLLGSSANNGVYCGYLPEEMCKTASLKKGDYTVYSFKINGLDMVLAIGKGAYYSLDGNVFIAIKKDNLNLEEQRFLSIAFSDSAVVLQGENEVLYSYDGKSFYTSGGLADQRINNVLCLKNTFYAFTDNGLYFSDNGNTFVKVYEKGDFLGVNTQNHTVFYGNDGAILHVGENSFYVIEEINCVSSVINFKDKTYLFVGDNGKVYSLDKELNKEEKFELSNKVKFALNSSDVLVCVLSDGKAYYSLDGEEFYLSIDTENEIISAKRILEKFFLLTKNSVYVSVDGINWSVLAINGEFSALLECNGGVFLTGEDGIFEIQLFDAYNCILKVSEEKEGGAIPLRNADGNISGVQEKLIAGANIEIKGNVISAKLSVDTEGGGSLSVDTELSDSSINPVENRVVTNALKEKGDTTVTVNGESVSTFDADTKLDKKEPIFPEDNNIIAYVYGKVTPLTNSHKPTPNEGMIPACAVANKNTIAMRDNVGGIRQTGISTYGTDYGYAFTDVNFSTYIRKPVELTGISGTITSAQYSALNFSPVLMISLDNELYTKVINDTTSQVMTYQHIDTTAIKTITVNSDYSWTLTVEEAKHVYSHYVAVNFTITGDGAGTGFTVMNLITNSAEPFTLETLYDYIYQNLYGADIVSSGRFINTSSQGAAVSTTWLSSSSNDALTVSVIYSSGNVGKSIYKPNGVNYVTNVKDNVIQLI